MDLWIPPTAQRPQPEVDVPLHDVTLTNGMKLRFLCVQAVDDPMTNTAGSWALYRSKDKQLRLLVSRDETHHGVLLHISVSRPDRYPGWDELIQIKHAFFGPNIDAMMVMPKDEDYVAIHPNCFHIWQTPVEWAVR